MCPVLVHVQSTATQNSLSYFRSLTCILFRRRSMEDRVMILQLFAVGTGPTTALCTAMRGAVTVKLKQSGLFSEEYILP